MLWTKLFIPTMRHDPANVQAVSHGLLVRAGYIQQLIAGAYSLLPLAQIVRRKIMDIIRSEMSSIGAQEFFLSALQPIELWDESGRTAAVSDVMFRLKDRKGSELALGLTHEEVFTSIARDNLTSYRQLPQLWYQMQTKFRDELRPKGGLLRVREFTMKDSYSFDLDEAGLDASFQLHREAYKKIFARCGLESICVDASSGAMGGAGSTEFMIFSESGEDLIVTCSECDYAANVEKAEAQVPIHAESPSAAEFEKFHTPNVRTIKQLEEFGEGFPAHVQIKTLVFVVDGRIILALVQGDQELNESKLSAELSSSSLRQATEAEIIETLQASPGSLGACSVEPGDGCKVSMIIADRRLQNRKNMVTGANENDFHIKGVSVGRDIKVDRFADLHRVKDADKCVRCGAAIKISSALEVGHIFKLGTRYSSTMNANVLHQDGSRKPILMGSYGIGVERLLAAIVEQHNDQFGIKWPISVAPYLVLIVPINWQNDEIRSASELLYAELRAAGFDVLLDDRDERAGVKFNDADLIGVPFRITVGKKAGDGIFEFKARGEKANQELNTAQILELLNAGEIRTNLAL